MTEQDAAGRLLALSNQVFEAFKKLDPKSPNYGKEVEALSKLYDAGVNDFKAHSDAEVQRVKIETEANVNYDRNAIEEQRNQEMERANKAGELLKKVSLGITAVVGLANAGSHIWAFKRSTAKEADDAFLTQTDRTTATEGLRKGFFSRLFGGKQEF